MSSYHWTTRFIFSGVLFFTSQLDYPRDLKLESKFKRFGQNIFRNSEKHLSNRYNTNKALHQYGGRFIVHFLKRFLGAIRKNATKINEQKPRMVSKDFWQIMNLAAHCSNKIIFYHFYPQSFPIGQFAKNLLGWPLF